MQASQKLFLCAALSFLVACGGADDEPTDELIDNTSEVEAYYLAHPERFVFATPQDLPANLDWQDGSGMDVFADPNAKRGGTLSLRLASMQQTLRITGPDANGTLRGPLWSANSVPLMSIHPWQEGYIPGVAKQWATDPNDSRITYLRIDPDARWSDGLPVTVDDLFFTLYFWLSPHIKSPSINRVWDDQLETITRFDEYTFSIKDKKASPEPLMFISSLTLVQREFYRALGEDYTDRYHWKFSPVTGAYTLDPANVDKGRRITMDRIENWWGDSKKYLKNRHNPDHIRYSLMRDDSKAFEAFLRGDFDWHSLQRTDLWHERADAEPITKGYIERAVVFDELPAIRSGIYMNADDSVLQNKTIRLGVQHAIHYELVNDALYRGDRRRIRSFSDGFGGYSHPTLRSRPYDVELAQDYFAQAGYKTRGPDGVLVNDSGQKLSLVLTVANNGNNAEVASLLKTEAMKSGLELSLDLLDRTAFFTKIFEKKFQIAQHSWNTGYSKLPVYQWELRGEDAGKTRNFNTTNIQDDELDALLAEWDTLTDPLRAKQVAHGIQERAHEFAAWVPGLTVDYTRWGYSRSIKWPDYFQVPRYFFFLESGVFWIDETVKQETQEAQKQDKSFAAKTTIYDRWKKADDS